MIRPTYALFAGGFAHVYLVRTATPVYNTTHHVLKRIAVANEGMLSEVKKEVDIMVRPMLFLSTDPESVFAETAERPPKHCTSHRCSMAPHVQRSV